MSRPIFARAIIVLAFLFAVAAPSRAETDLGRAIIQGLIGGALNSTKQRPPREGGGSRQGRSTRSPAGAWTSLAPANGTGTTICNTDKDKYSCFALRCSAGGGAEFVFLYNVGKYQASPTARIAVDDAVKASLPFRTTVAGREMVSAFVADRDTVLIEALKAGNSFTFDPGFKHRFSLSGSTKRINETLKACGTGQPGEPLVEAPAVVRQPVVRINEDFGGNRVEWHERTDIWGGDIDTGMTNPRLAGIEMHQCEDLCRLDGRCKAFTFNLPRKICLLKDGTGTKKPDENAWSAVFLDRDTSRPPVERAGPAVSFSAATGWKKADAADSYSARIRTAAKAMAGSCEVERESLERLRGSMTFDVSQESATTGDVLSIDWSGNTLLDRVPAWLVVSTDKPVRYTGKGFHSLMPGAPGPFGVKTDRDKSRALVALYSRSAGSSGTIGVMPLLAGPLAVNVTLVGYVRGCEEVVELGSRRFSLAVKPAAPRIVLHDPFGKSVYDRSVDVAEHRRVVLFNDQRLLILDKDDQSEILERAGSNLAVSPSGRFVVVRSDNGTEVIDIVDGTTVARLGDDVTDSRLEWFLNDSFVMTHRAPWGRSWFASTLNPRKPLHHPETSPSCCSMDNETEVDPETDLVDIDQENNLVRIQGINAGLAADLQDLSFVVGTGPSGRRDGGSYDTSQVLDVARAVGPVAPLSTDFVWNFVSGTPSEAPMKWPVVPSVASPQPVELASAEAEPIVDLRGAVALQRKPLVAGNHLLDLEPFGFQTAPEQPLEIHTYPLGARYDDPEIEQKTKAFEARQKQARDLIRKELRAQGLKLSWMTPTGDFMTDVYCDYIKDEFQDVRGDEVPGALDLAQRASVDGRPIWVVRSQCDGGPTGGTQVYKSSLMIWDGSRVSGRVARDAIVATSETLGTAGYYKFHDLPLQTKLIGSDLLLFYAPGRGAIGLFDLAANKFSFTWQGLKRGDLLVDAKVSADRRHILQVNSDGSFALYAANDGSLVIEGRQLDGETIFWTPDFRFDSTAEGASFVQLRFPGQSGQYTFQQFDARLRQPGLFAAALAGQSPPPQPVIGVPPRLAAKVEATGNRITGNATASGPGSVKEIRLFQDGVLTDTLPAPAQDTPLAFDVTRLPGARWITMMAVDHQGLVSLPVGRDLGLAAAKPVARVLAVGVNAYNDPKIRSLNLAARDADTLYGTLKAVDAIAVDQATSRALFDAAGSKDAILAAARDIAAASTPGDSIVFFFAGHGLQGKDGRFYLGLSETRLDDIDATALAWSELAGILASAKGRITVLLDACHSGMAGTSLFTSNDDAVDSLRSVIPSGLTVLAASKGREFSAELGAIGGGAFTIALTEAIGKDRASTDLNANGVVEVSELYRAVKDRVVELRGGEQTPWLARNQMIGDFAVF